MAGIVQRAGQKALVVLEPLLDGIVRKSVALVLGHHFRPLYQPLMGPALRGKVGAGCSGGAVAFNTVGLPHGNGFVVQAVVQRFREWQDVFDFNLLTQQHGRADLHT